MQRVWTHTPGPEWWVRTSKGQNARLAAGSMPAWQLVGGGLCWLALILGGNLLTGLPASLDEELQTTLRDLRHQIQQAMGGKGAPQGL